MTGTTEQTSEPLFRLPLIAALVVAELLAIAITYQLATSIECRNTEIELACRALRSMTARGLAVIAVLTVFFCLRRRSYRNLATRAALHPGHPVWLWVHLAGIGLIFLPLPLFGPGEIGRVFAPSLRLMSLGGALAATGAVLWVTSAQNWHQWLRGDRYYLPLVICAGVLIPDLADSMQPLWGLRLITDGTFVLVFSTLDLLSTDIWADLSQHLISLEGFTVRIGAPCSGVEGLALITAFMAIYAVLLRGEIRQLRFWLVFYPIALICSLLFNVLRIALLLLVGARMSADHAVNGFHSYAGWLMFTLLSLAVLYAAHRFRWLHRPGPDNAPAAPPVAEDMLVASIAPFIVMMLSGVIAAVLWSDPPQGYPLRVILMAAALIVFRRPILRCLCRPAPLDLLAGLAVGVIWIVAAADPSGISAPPDTLWILLRLAGTIFLVPVIEELFFRGYVLRRLDDGGPARRLLALVISSLLFGLLHDRYLVAAGTGLVFGLLMLRRGQLGSAINAHVTANAVVGLWAMRIGDWALI